MSGVAWLRPVRPAALKLLKGASTDPAVVTVPAAVTGNRCGAPPMARAAVQQHVLGMHSAPLAAE